MIKLFSRSYTERLVGKTDAKARTLATVVFAVDASSVLCVKLWPGWIVHCGIADSHTRPMDKCELIVNYTCLVQLNRTHSCYCRTVLTTGIYCILHVFMQSVTNQWQSFLITDILYCNWFDVNNIYWVNNSRIASRHTFFLSRDISN